jgi:CRP-like cAMP-binding protein
MPTLQDLLATRVALAPDELGQILARFAPKNLRKGAHLLRKGQVCSSYYYVEKGCLRIYLKEAVEVTGWFALEGEFFSELASLKKQQPTAFYIQSIEDTTLWIISKPHMDELYARFPQWQQFGRQIWEDAFLRVIEAILAHQTLTAEDRYRHLLGQGNVLQRIPLKYLASFLGVTPTSLSRIRKSISRS